jgi:uncharacterized flavoprotein (TIGR03862 family)
MAAEVLSAAGVSAHVYDAMPSVGRKFLLAGLGGLNLTHAEPFDIFTARYAERNEACATWLKTFDATAICEWVKGLGLDTFVGSSQRIFPTDMKAAPLLRAWLHRLRHPVQGAPVTFHMRHRWNGTLHPVDKKFTLSFDTPHGTHTAHADAVLLALGGGSWAKLGSDGAWQPWLDALGLDVSPLRPSNCGFDVQGRDGHAGWSSYLSGQFAGAPLKSVTLSFTDSAGRSFSRRGEFVVTTTGLEGNLVYAASALLRDEIARSGSATLHLDLKPDFTSERVLAEVSHPRGTRSLSSHLKSRLNLNALHLGLLHEVLSREQPCAIGSGHQTPAHHAGCHATDRRSHQQCRRCAFRSAGRAPHGHRSARLVCCGRNVGLGSPHWRLLTQRLLGQWPRGRVGCRKANGPLTRAEPC